MKQHHPAEKLGEALAQFKNGRWADAERLCRDLLTHQPDHGEAWNRLGHALEKQGRLTEAVAAWSNATTHLDDSTDAHNNMATALQRLGQTAKAIVHYQSALQRRPNDATILSNYGAALRQQGLIPEAIRILEKSLLFAPNDAAAHTNLGVALCLQASTEKGLWHLKRAVELKPNFALAHENLCLCLNYSDLVSRDEAFAAHRRYGHLLSQTAQSKNAPRGQRQTTRPLRVGFVSGDFRSHSVAYFIEPLFAHHHADRFHFTAYSNTRREDAVTQRLKSLIESWRDITTMSDAAAIETIRSDGIDILIDLSGHTSGNRMGIFAHRAAPVQITYLGYPNTTGLTSVDFRLTDRWAEPDDAAAFYSETLLHMEHGFLCYQPSKDAPEVAPPPSEKTGYITFGCFNSLAKLSPTTVRMWAEILAKVPQSRLCLKDPRLSDETTTKQILNLLSQAGIQSDRIVLQGFSADHRSHMEAYHNIDIALDAFPYNGTTTTCEALWMGVPTVTLCGRAHASRVGYSLLHRLNLSQWVAHSNDEYIEIAVKFANDRTARLELRQTLRNQIAASSLTNAELVTTDFEQGLERSWSTNEIAPKLPPGSVWANTANGMAIAVPDDIFQMTTWVLTEQHDWFEDEIHFVRKLVQPGDQTLDIGANHGVYTLSMAAAVGAEGRVVAFEPSHLTAERLRASVTRNGLSQVTVVEAALSKETGQATLFTGTSSELSSLHDIQTGPNTARAHETVQVFSLDSWDETHKLASISLIKLDAEGEEVNVLSGAERVLNRDDPLLLCELKHGAAVNLPLVAWLKAHDYALFRLVPGLNVLIPYPPDSVPEPFQLNIFAARSKRASLLAARGLLCQEIAARDTLPAEPHFTTLEYYALAHRVTLSCGQRAAALQQALHVAMSSMEQSPTLCRMMTMARVASEWGLRAVALEALKMALLTCARGGVSLNEPFLSPCRRFDSIDPGNRLADWLLSNLIEQIEKLRAFSNYFNWRDSQTLAQLQTLARHEFQSEEMARRLQLVVEARRAHGLSVVA